MQEKSPLEELEEEMEDEVELVTERETMQFKQELSQDQDDILRELNKEDDPFAQRIRYVSEKTDEVDQMLGAFLELNDIRVPIHRIKEKQYLFGTKKISAQIINKKLMVRVGGGFMTI